MIPKGRWEIAHYPALQFSLFRMLFGSYLVIHFVELLAFAPAIWSNQGMLPDSGVNLSAGTFPNLLAYLDSPLQTQLFLGVMIALSLCLLLGFGRRTAALLLWFGWACLFHRNNLISNPGLPMVGWLLLALALIPNGEPWRLGGKETDRTWYMPAPLFWGAWAILGASYTISGFDKLGSPSWLSGEALAVLLQNPLARDSFVRDLFLHLPHGFLALLTWSALALEIAFGFLCIFRKTRPWAWFVMLAMHLGILTLIDFADLTFGVLMLHFFVFDPAWFKKPIGETHPLVFFDGVCGMCNATVNTLLALDPRGDLHFSPLQGQAAARMLDPEIVERCDSIVFVKDGTTYMKSDAALQILRSLGGPWALLSVFRFVPKGLRDGVYAFIAKNRYRFFGKHETCRIPTPAERARFLD
jgi:predicted DCC family thiol-disulfide oxidoreductase YuxK